MTADGHSGAEPSTQAPGDSAFVGLGRAVAGLSYFSSDFIFPNTSPFFHLLLPRGPPIISQHLE